MKPEEQNEQQLEPEILTTQVFSNELVRWVFHESNMFKNYVLEVLNCKLMWRLNPYFFCQIWKTLGPCLNTSDLKCCRLVNQKFNRMVMDVTEFRDKVVLKLKKEKLELEEFGKSEEAWKKISLEFPAEKVSDPSNYTWLLPLLKEVNFLSLRLHKRKSVYQINFHPLLGQLLSSCTKLKSLSLEPDFIRYGSGGIFRGNETLKKLEELEILEPNYRWTDFCGPFSDSEDQVAEKEYQLVTEFGDALENVKIFKSYFAQIKTHWISGVGADDSFRQPNFLRHVCKIVVKNNRKHLESHPFYDGYELKPYSINLDAFHPEHFETPALKSLQADASQLGATLFNVVFHMNWPFLEYLTSRPPLSQVEISYPLGNPINILLWVDVIEALGKHARSLKTWKMQADLLQTCNWSPMRNLNLVELSLEDLRKPKGQNAGVNHNDWIPEVIMNLPGSIRRIYLKGAEGLKAKMKLKVQDFSQCDPNLVEELSIFNAGGCLTNDVTQFLCENFKMLRKFHLSDCKTDDQGFLGISEMKGEFEIFIFLKYC